jgi:cyclohexanecarboxylate-CoA ligase
LVYIYRRHELQFMLTRARTKVLVVPDSFRGFDHAGLAMELWRDLADLEHVIVATDALDMVHAGARNFERNFLGHEWDLVPDRSQILAARRRGSDEVASLMYTSGTTGEPKGTLHTYNTLWSAGRGMFVNMGLGEGDVGLMASPMGHLTGYLWGMLQPLSRGMTAVFQDVWDAGRFLDVIDVERITWSLGATPFVVDSITEQQRSQRKFSSLKYFVCAGAPIPPALSQMAIDVLGARLLAMWGTSECGAVTYSRPDDSVETVASSDGHPIPFMELALMDADNQAVKHGVEGRLVVRGPSVFLGYLGRMDLYSEVVDADGWFDTGDLGVEAADGSVRITGRSKDIIIRGGQNIPVVEVENLLFTHPKVKEVAVIGIPDFRMGEKGCAVVIPKDAPPTLDELTAYLSESGMAKQYWPEHLVIRAEMPRTASGKIQKFALRNELKAALAT